MRADDNEGIARMPEDNSDEIYLAGIRKGLQHSKTVYRRIHTGGCRMLSKGDMCECFLCQIDNLTNSPSGLDEVP